MDEPGPETRGGPPRAGVGIIGAVPSSPDGTQPDLHRGAVTPSCVTSGGMNDDAATLLVVDDDESARTYLADNLTADGYAVVVADGARDTVRLLESKFPDLVLLDDGLPDGSGF